MSLVQSLWVSQPGLAGFWRFPLEHYFSLMCRGNMVDTYGPEQALLNREALYNEIGIGSHSVVVMRPVHGIGIENVTRAEYGGCVIECDAMITEDPTVVLALRPADCFPIIIFSRKPRVLALIHAGWKGSDAGIIAETIHRMYQAYPDLKPEHLRVGIGPGIHSCCYDEPHTVDALRDKRQWHPFILEKASHAGRDSCDLRGFCIQELQQARVLPDNITVASACTCCAQNLLDGTFLFPSHHRAKGGKEPEARFVVLVALQRRTPNLIRFLGSYLAK